MGVCTAFVFATLVEFTCVNYLWRKRSNPYKLTNLDFNGFPEELRAQAEFDAEMECGDGGGNGNCSREFLEKITKNFVYRVVQLDFTPDTEVFYLLLELLLI